MSETTGDMIENIEVSRVTRAALCQLNMGVCALVDRQATRVAPEHFALFVTSFTPHCSLCFFLANPHTMPALLTKLAVACLALAGLTSVGHAKDVCCGPDCAGCCHWEGDICTSRLLNVPQGRLLPGIGGYGGGGFCQKWKSGKQCDASVHQLINPVDFDTDPSEQYLYVADQGYDIAAYGTGNSSRLLRFDLKNPEAGPVIMSHCGQFVRVKYDAERKQVIVLRRTIWNDGIGHQTGGTEILRFHPMDEEAQGTTCVAKFDKNPSLKGRTIGRKGLLPDLHSASTMFLLGNSKLANNSVLVGDENQYCVLAYPLDGSYGSTIKGIPVAGTCGKGSDIGVPISTEGKAGKVLSTSDYHLYYHMFPSANDGSSAGELPTTVALHDMNHGTIDLGDAPQAKKNFPMVPILSRSSSLYGVPLWDRRKSPKNPDLIVVDMFGSRVATRVAKGQGQYKDGYDGSKGDKLFDLSSWTAQWADEHNQTQPVQGLPMHWKWTSEGKLLALMAYSYSNMGKVDAAFVEFDVKR